MPLKVIEYTGDLLSFKYLEGYSLITNAFRGSFYDEPALDSGSGTAKVNATGKFYFSVDEKQDLITRVTLFGDTSYTLFGLKTGMTKTAAYNALRALGWTRTYSSSTVEEYQSSAFGKLSLVYQSGLLGMIQY